MEKSEKRNITRRLIFSFCLLILILLIFGLKSLYDIRTLSGLTRTIYDHPLVVSNAALQANVSITKMHRNMKDVVLFKSSDRTQQSIAAVDRQEQLVYQYLDVVRHRILGDEGRILENETRILFDRWRPIRTEVIALVRNGQRDKAAEITIGKGADHVDKLEKKMVALTDYARTKATAFMNQAEKKYSNLNIFLIISLILAISVSSLIAIFTLKGTASAENELRESRQLLVNAIDYAPIGMVLVKPEGKFYKINAAFCEITGYSKEALFEMHFQELTYPDDYDIGSNAVKQLIEGKIDRASLEKRYIKKDGSIIDVYLTSSLLRDSKGSPLYFFTQIQDITERKQSEQRIVHLNRVLRAIRDVNQLIVRERDPEALIRKGCRLLVDNRGYLSVLIVLTDENDRPLSWAGAGFASSSETMKAMLERQELPPCCYVAQSAAEVMVIDDRSSVCGKCPIAEGCSETLSLCARLTHKSKAFGYIVAAPDSALSVDDEEQSLFAEMAGDLAYALNFLRIETAHKSSERKRERLEGQLIQAQKLESVGRLAGGVAHDYNNMLSIITGYAELALEKVDPNDLLHADLMEILTAAKRSTAITRQLLGFARQQTIEAKVIDLNDTIEHMLKMLRKLIGEDIDLAWLPGAEVWPVRMDPSQIDQILANLCANARDSIADVGKVTIETKNISFDKDYCAEHAEFVPGKYVMLAVSDNGSGIFPETLDKIFEPFFTTKGIGKGTGLGLATVYGIVKQNNGFINVYSEPKEGTTIKIYLQRDTGHAVEVYHESSTEIPFGLGETVLMVEDDGSILKLGRRMLEDLDYTVLIASSPAEALNMVKGYEGKIHLLITDVVMPEMNGRELSEQLRTLYPDLKVLFMSGYTANVIAHRGVLEEGVFFIPKPLSKKALALKVRETLDNAGNG